MTRRILVSGASIAGNATALALTRRGFDVTVIERSDTFRDGGQNVDVRGVGREVLDRLELEQAALDHGTGEEGTVWVNEDGSAAARFAADDTGNDGPTAEMEILRGDLARLLYDAACGAADYRFGATIAAIDDRAGSLAVTFADGGVEQYDLVVVAEGVGSATRDLVFGDANDPRWLDMTIAYFTIPRSPDDDRMWRWYNAPGKRSISLRPDMHGTTRAMLSLHKEPADEQHWDVARQKAFLHECFADAGWETPRILAAMDAAEDFYFDVLRQVRMPRWSSGRIVLTGDAAWCVTPIGGIGATLAITGGYVLAAELARTDDVAAALDAYEEQLRPMVEEGQGIPKIGPRLMHPKTSLGIKLLHGVLGLASLEPVRNIAAGVFGEPKERVDLSRYDADTPR